MENRMKYSAVGIVALLCSFSFGLAQQDAFSIRNKYGAPLDRETFRVRPEIEMVVDYGAGKQVCRIQLPSGRRYGGVIPEDAVTKEKIDELLTELAPV